MFFTSSVQMFDVWLEYEENISLQKPTYVQRIEKNAVYFAF